MRLADDFLLLPVDDRRVEAVDDDFRAALDESDEEEDKEEDEEEYEDEDDEEDKREEEEAEAEETTNTFTDWALYCSLKSLTQALESCS